MTVHLEALWDHPIKLLQLLESSTFQTRVLSLQWNVSRFYLIFLKTKSLYQSKPAQTNLFLISTLRLNSLCAFLTLPRSVLQSLWLSSFQFYHVSQKGESCQDHHVLLALCLLLQCLYSSASPLQNLHYIYPKLVMPTVVQATSLSIMTINRLFWEHSHFVPTTLCG